MNKGKFKHLSLDEILELLSSAREYKHTEFVAELEAEMILRKSTKEFTDQYPEEEQNILFFAFRYALGRRTGAVSMMVGYIINRWKKLSERNRVQMKEEIRDAITTSRAGDDCDVVEWQRILAL